MPSLCNRRFGPLPGRTFSLEGFAMVPAPDAARLVFRARDGAVAAAGRAFGIDLPREACRAAATGARAALWMGPDEWLLLGPDSEAVLIEGQLIKALAGLAHSVVDVSHRDVGLELSGAKAAAALNAGCPLDLHPSAFPTGMCTRTLLAKAEIVLWRRGPQLFHVETWRSFADYVWRFFEQAGRDADT
jgi:sarcosine oxidase, subunit gamma